MNKFLNYCQRARPRLPRPAAVVLRAAGGVVPAGGALFNTPKVDQLRFERRREGMVLEACESATRRGRTAAPAFATLHQYDTAPPDGYGGEEGLQASGRLMTLAGSDRVAQVSGFAIVVDECDAHILSARVWRVEFTGPSRVPYVVNWCAGALHRVIMGAVAGELIDHIDGDTFNNRRGNLRRATRAVNAQNRRRPSRNNKTGFLGVDYVPAKYPSRPYRAQIKVRGKKLHIGTYVTAEEAHAAYVEAKRRFHEGCTL